MITNMKNKYLRLNLTQVEHLYELSYEHLQEECSQCGVVREKLEEFIWKKGVETIKKMLKKNWYC